MPALNILYNKSFNDIKDAIRRLTNDIDAAQVAVNEHQLSEMVTTEFINLSHEAGFDPRTATRPTSEDQELTYSLAAGDYFIPVESSADIVAINGVWHNWSTRPLDFLPRHELENLINNDIRTQGTPVRGIPNRWSLRWAQGTLSGNVAAVMQHQLLVYPASDRALTVYWPRTLVDAATMDPSLTTGRPPFSYQLTYALQYKVAAMCIDASTDESLKVNKVNRQVRDMFWTNYMQALDRERGERAMNVRLDHVRERVH